MKKRTLNLLFLAISCSILYLTGCDKKNLQTSILTIPSEATKKTINAGIVIASDEATCETSKIALKTCNTICQSQNGTPQIKKSLQKDSTIGLFEKCDCLCVVETKLPIQEITTLTTNTVTKTPLSTISTTPITTPIKIQTTSQTPTISITPTIAPISTPIPIKITPNIYATPTTSIKIQPPTTPTVSPIKTTPITTSIKIQTTTSTPTTITTTPTGSSTPIKVQSSQTMPSICGKEIIIKNEVWTSYACTNECCIQKKQIAKTNESFSKEMCQENTWQCKGGSINLLGKIEKCKNGKWEIEGKCGNDQICLQENERASCVTCQNGEKKCNGKFIMECWQGTWKVKEMCEKTCESLQSSQTQNWRTAICQ